MRFFCGFYLPNLRLILPIYIYRGKTDLWWTFVPEEGLDLGIVQKVIQGEY